MQRGGLVHDVVNSTSPSWDTVTTACGVWLLRIYMHNQPKVVTCLHCICGQYKK